MFDLMRINEAYENMQKPQPAPAATKTIATQKAVSKPTYDYEGDVEIDSDDYIEPNLNATKVADAVMGIKEPTPSQSAIKGVNNIRTKLMGFVKDNPSTALRAMSAGVKKGLTQSGRSLDSLYKNGDPINGERVRTIAAGMELSGLSDPENAMKMQQDIDGKRYGEVLTRSTENIYNNIFNKDGNGVPWSAVTNSPAAHYPFEQWRQGKQPSPISVTRALDAAANNIDKYNAARQTQPKPSTTSTAVLDKTF